jgi:signal peptidase II
MLFVVNDNTNTRVAALLLAVLVLGLDQLSKQAAVYLLRDTGATLALPGPVDLTLVFNRSNAFGLVPVSGALTRWGLTGLNLAVVAGLVWAVLRGSMPGVGMIGLGCIIAGAAGNALDRIQYGAVIDFIDAAKLGFVWIFNLADVALDVGIGLWMLGIVRPGVRPGRPGHGPFASGG